MIEAGRAGRSSGNKQQQQAFLDLLNGLGYRRETGLDDVLAVVDAKNALDKFRGKELTRTQATRLITQIRLANKQGLGGWADNWELAGFLMGDNEGKITNGQIMDWAKSKYLEVNFGSDAFKEAAANLAYDEKWTKINKVLAANPGLKYNDQTGQFYRPVQPVAKPAAAGNAAMSPAPMPYPNTGSSSQKGWGQQLLDALWGPGLSAEPAPRGDVPIMQPDYVPEKYREILEQQQAGVEKQEPSTWEKVAGKLWELGEDAINSFEWEKLGKFNLHHGFKADAGLFVGAGTQSGKYYHLDFTSLEATNESLKKLLWNGYTEDGKYQIDSPLGLTPGMRQGRPPQKTIFKPWNIVKGFTFWEVGYEAFIVGGEYNAYNLENNITSRVLDVDAGLFGFTVGFGVDKERGRSRSLWDAKFEHYTPILGGSMGAGFGVTYSNSDLQNQKYSPNFNPYPSPAQRRWFWE